MGDIDEIEQAKAWIYGALSANADITAVVGTRIFSDYVPEPPANRVYPYILFDFLAGPDVQGLGVVRQGTRALFQIRVVTSGRPNAASRKVVKRIDDVLRVAVQNLSGEFYYTAEREQPVNRAETDASTGVRYHNIGGLYRVWIGRTIG